MRFTNNAIYLSTGNYKTRNYLEHNRVYYNILLLNPKYSKSRGGNSSVFKLIDPNTEKEYAVKFSKYPIENNVNENMRFDREIQALYRAKKEGLENVIEIMFDGQKKVDGKTFPYYVMEKADTDLKSFIIENNVLPSQKILFCYEMIKGIQELHSIDIYHRDIKPDNIFFINNGGKSRWKIGDLGLMAFRNEDLKKFEFQKKVGPVGWLSPEAINKVVCEGTRFEAINDCNIDSHSDVFQLGNVFWFMFMYCVPMGQVTYGDFKIKNEALFEAIIKMLQHKKSRRKNIDYYNSEFEELVS